ncbi:DnaJ subfamily B member like [Heracleum sosnowskyi]|uniref:DnaJ subfamily B member like n=1 Tax=Heracleum sosnowskyi TaxID=360622 RepID=A0AAD8HZ02_9APIA|nr:DnaJ subfamily B member like [Heracleum sosnowskyi]
MESVELDAKRAKQIVEIKLHEKDIKGAISFSKKVQSLFPELKRIFQFIGNLDVHVSNDEQEIDWYTVLGVDPCADVNTLKQCYVKLTKRVHESQEAYKILDKAWSILSNKFEREAYDLRRSRAMQNNALIEGQATSANENISKAFSNVDNAVISHRKRSRTDCNTGARDQKSGFAAIEDPGPQLISPNPNFQASYAPRPSDIFWSNKMNSQPVMHNVSGEYRSGVNLPPSASIGVPFQPKVICPYPNFHASNAPRPSNTFRPDKMKSQPNLYGVSGRCERGKTPVSSSATVPNPKVSTPCPNSRAKSAPQPPNTFLSGKTNIQPGLYNALGEYGSDQTVVSSSVIVPSQRVTSPFQNSQASNAPPSGNTFWSDKMNIQPGMDNVSGEHGSGRTVVLSAKELIKPSRVNLKRGYEEGNQTSETREKAPCIYLRESGIGKPSINAGSYGNEGVKHDKRAGSADNIHDSSKNVPQNDMAAASGVDRQKGVSERHMGNSLGEKISVYATSKSNSRKKLPDFTSLLVRRARTEILGKMEEWSAAARKKKECSAIHCIENANAEDSRQDGLMTMEVPDSDFHNFDKERTPLSFGEKQVWAVYDDDDGMPRLYALIQEVLSKRPLKLQISWLNASSNKELGPLNWIDSGFQKTCGEFWVGKKQINNTLNSFSHRVSGWTKSAKVYQIFPRKGDVWALYRNWSPNWNELTTKEEKHKYDVVEVLEDYNEGKGVMIIPLGKVAGFKSVFCRPLDAKEARTIPKEEIFRFSHQVMSCLLTGQEAPNVPKGSRELDPAALPLELLRVLN